ncbi:MAG: RNA ligase family protein [Myxococcota bacterium]
MNTYVKYPRTPHLPFSPGACEDDVWVDTTAIFSNQRVLITEKMDGENTTLYSDHMHARSLDSRHHPSRSWVKGLHHRIAHHIPARWRICGENLFARHSIGYDTLPSYFMVFSIWTDEGACLAWDETVEWCEMLELEHVPVLFDGPWDEALVRAMADEVDTSAQEGFVVRLADGFAFKAFKQSVAKWVRKDHVTTDTHWMHREVVPNGVVEPS